MDMTESLAAAIENSKRNSNNSSVAFSMASILGLSNKLSPDSMTKTSAIDALQHPSLSAFLNSHRSLKPQQDSNNGPVDIVSLPQLGKYHLLFN